VGEFEHGQLVAAVELDSAPDDAGGDLAKVVVHDRGSRLACAQQICERAVRSWGDADNQEEGYALVFGH
jgi:hypothetical protein